MTRPDRAVTHGLAAALLIVVFAGCATTVDEESGGTVDEISTPATTGSTLPVTGSADDLLAGIGDDMRTLSGDIGGDGDQQATLARIEAAWDAIRAEVETTRPELFSGLSATIDMARTAVVSNRPADADKAYSILRDLIDAFENAAA